MLDRTSYAQGGVSFLRPVSEWSGIHFQCAKIQSLANTTKAHNAVTVNITPPKKLNCLVNFPSICVNVAWINLRSEVSETTNSANSYSARSARASSLATRAPSSALISEVSPCSPFPSARLPSRFMDATRNQRRGEAGGERASGAIGWGCSDAT